MCRVLLIDPRRGGGDLGFNHHNGSAEHADLLIHGDLGMGTVDWHRGAEPTPPPPGGTLNNAERELTYFSINRKFESTEEVFM